MPAVGKALPALVARKAFLAMGMDAVSLDLPERTHALPIAVGTAGCGAHAGDGVGPCLRAQDATLVTFGLDSHEVCFLPCNPHCYTMNK